MDSFRKDSGPRTAGNPEELRYAEATRVDLDEMTRTASGLYYLDREVGTGALAEPGKVVAVGYVGMLSDGFVFDRSGMGSPFRFMLGRRQVIDGWDEGVAGMRVGGRRQLVIPPRLAYGQQSPGAGIPPNATLVFEVSLEGVGE